MSRRFKIPAIVTAAICVGAVAGVYLLEKRLASEEQDAETKWRETTLEVRVTCLDYPWQYDLELNGILQLTDRGIVDIARVHVLEYSWWGSHSIEIEVGAHYDSGAYSARDVIAHDHETTFVRLNLQLTFL